MGGGVEGGGAPQEAMTQEIRSACSSSNGRCWSATSSRTYGFVHIEDKTAAEDAIRNLHHHKLHGRLLSKNRGTLHVGNIGPACTNLELRAKSRSTGPVIECDIVKDYAFVHMERAEDAVEAIRGLDNTEFQAAVPLLTAWAVASFGSVLVCWGGFGFFFPFFFFFSFFFF
uniref:RRM domain-containing protein n=1 Tax=Coturnix japonica TaxID=93934 RepID=A0A8C2Y4U3_COTJA